MSQDRTVSATASVSAMESPQRSSVIRYETVRTMSISASSNQTHSNFSSPHNSEASTSAMMTASPKDDSDLSDCQQDSTYQTTRSYDSQPPPYSDTDSAKLKTHNEDTNSLTSDHDELETDSFPVEGSRKLGYRRVEDNGVVTYKNIESAQIIGSIQIGIRHSIGSLASKPERDVLFNDFNRVEAIPFPKSGSQTTPAHNFDDFTFTTFTPNAFRHFRDLFGIQPDDYMLSMSEKPLIELTNPGASGSMFFRTHDDRFILKTVEKNECNFLLKLLAGYYLNLSQNPDTLLPKFYGLYTYECSGRNIRLIVMNNLLPSHVKIHRKYDLKGSTFKRKASASESKKSSPTYKDLDFLEHHDLNTLYRTRSQMNMARSDSLAITDEDESQGRGLLLAPNTYEMLIDILNRDCRVLESFAIMDYSLLVAVHNHDRFLETQQELQEESGFASFEYEDDDQLPAGAIRAVNAKGERLLLFVGVIDILQSYRLFKRVEHAWKALLYDGKTVSVVKPKFYAQRFLEFMNKFVFGRKQQNEKIDKRLHYYRYAENLKTGSLQRMRKFGSMLR